MMSDAPGDEVVTQAGIPAAMAVRAASAFVLLRCAAKTRNSRSNSALIKMVMCLAMPERANKQFRQKIDAGHLEPRKPDDPVNVGRPEVAGMQQRNVSWMHRKNAVIPLTY